MLRFLHPLPIPQNTTYSSFLFDLTAWALVGTVAFYVLIESVTP